MISACLCPRAVGAEEEALKAGSLGKGKQESSRFSAGVNDGIIWNCAISRQLAGDVSYAVVQANDVVEDYSQVSSGSFGTFVGIFDGHGGQQAAKFASENLLPNLQRCMEKRGQAVTVQALEDAIMETEGQLLKMVRENWHKRPQFASVGTCCLVGVVRDNTVILASLGDSKAVLGSARRFGFGMGYGMSARQLTKEHNAGIESVREEMWRRFPKDKTILVEKSGVWRVKGIIQITRSLGDFYLKMSEFQNPPLLERFRLPTPLVASVLTCEPYVATHRISPLDSFIIFASDGLWEHVTNQEAVDIVHTYPRAGIARRLVKLAMIRAAKKRGLNFFDLKVLHSGKRREVHDDISVVVLFLDRAGAKGGSGGHSRVDGDPLDSSPSLRAFHDLPGQLEAASAVDPVEDDEFWRR